MNRTVMVAINRVANVVVGKLKPKSFRGGQLLYLRTIGRKTGGERMTPLCYLPDGDSWIVAASNGGNDWEPGWWLNLQAGSPATVDGTPVTGAEVEEPERAEWWARLNAVLDYEAYQRKVSRRIAVVRLTPTPG